MVKNIRKKITISLTAEEWDALEIYRKHLNENELRRHTDFPLDYSLEDIISYAAHKRVGELRGRFAGQRKDGRGMTVAECIERYEKDGIETVINDGKVVNVAEKPEDAAMEAGA